LKENYGGIVQNICWKVFYETEVHLDYAKIYSKNKASNVIVTGYPALELLLKGKAKKDPWKIKNKYLKRIIWAPHHTINSQGCGLNLSNFELYANFIFEIAQKNFSRIQIAFKPHPLLKTKLINDPSWGKNKTNSYFESWNELNNCFLVDGNYIDLFLTSDAMIHDSGSFTVEYLCTQKPVLYTLKNMNQLNSLNEFGKNAVNCHYKALNTSDIEKFIFKTVLNENDPMKHKRKDFKKKYLNSSKNASQKIFNNISKEIYSYL
jgi:CDP-glycerol glycerophosphotransferase (TagB/SpsB family)